MACRASSTSPSTAADAWPCSKTPTTSALPRSLSGRARRSVAGVYFRMLLGGVTGHGTFARDSRRAARAGQVVAGRRRDPARLHRPWRPHRPQAGAAQIPDRPLGHREVSSAEAARYLAISVASGAARRLRTARDRSTSTAISASTGNPSPASPISAWCCRPGVCSAPQLRGARRDRRAPRLRHPAADGVAEPADLRHSRPQSCRRHRPKSRRSASPPRPAPSAAAWSPAPAMPAANLRSATPSAHGAGAGRLSRFAARARPADQHPSDRLPEFLRPALCRRYRPAWRPRSSRRRRRGRGLSRHGRRRQRRRAPARPRDLPLRAGRRVAAADRDDAAALSRDASCRRDAFGLFEPPQPGRIDRGCSTPKRPWIA